MTGNTRYIFKDYSFIISGLVLLLVLFIRVTRGLDLTDEMQYYGEIKGLIETGRLFSNDLFIQQSVYILFYPLFYVYHLICGFECFVFFGRLLMSLLTIVVFFYAYRKLLVVKFRPLTASLAALALTFAIPYHGIFAPSYNTISQIIWIIFVLKFLEWKWGSIISWGILPIIMVFAHPSSAVMMTLLIVVRLILEREYKILGTLLLVFLAGTFIVLPVIFYFAAPQEYLASLTFSSGYGVGTSFFSDKAQPVTLLCIYALFGVCLLLGRQFNRPAFSILSILCIVIAIKSFLAGRIGGAYTIRVVYTLSCLSALGYGWALSNVFVGDNKSRKQNHWLVVGLLAYATTLGVTSGNGIGQTTGAFMVGFPLLMGRALNTETSTESPDSFSLFKITCMVLVVILGMVHWIRYPYREDLWWRATHPIQSVPEFKFVNTSKERALFIQRMQHDLRPVTLDKRTLLVSEYPGLYFAMGAQAETCMLYMHSLTSDKSEKALLRCLNQKQPEVVVDLFTNSDFSKEHSRIKDVMHNFYNKRVFDCTTESIALNTRSNYNPNQLKYILCK